jgi:U3 small nucleolar RNA-associated protein 18
MVKRGRTGVKSSAEEALEDDIFGKELDVIAPQGRRGGVDEGSGDDEPAAAAAWEDEDDEELEVMLDDTARLRKLKKAGDDGDGGKVSGAEFSARLQQRLQSRNLAWASHFDDIYGASKQDKILRDSTSLADCSSAARKALQPGKLDIARLVDANVDGQSKDVISATSFHSSGSLLLTGGKDKHLRFFHVDGEVNERQLAVRITDMPIR